MSVGCVESQLDGGSVLGRVCDRGLGSQPLALDSISLTPVPTFQGLGVSLDIFLSMEGQVIHVAGLAFLQEDPSTHFLLVGA